MTATHPDALAFTAAIVAAPGDDLPRLVFADWLDETGESARAEFIRCQCERAAIWPGDALPALRDTLAPSLPQRDRWLTLFGRERTLFDDFGRGLLGPALPAFALRLPNVTLRYAAVFGPAGDRYHVAAFRRGFVDEVRLTVQAFAGGRCGYRGRGVRRRDCRKCKGRGRREGLAKALFRVHPIAAVDLSDVLPINTGSSGWPDDPTPPRWCFRRESKLYSWQVRSVLPPVLFDRVAADPGVVRRTGPAGEPGEVAFESSADALTAVSRACVAFGRAEAGL